MKIFVTFGIGEGSTKLAAFDRALYDAGIGNYNLIKLSSVIPPGSEVIAKKVNWNEKEIGDKLYVVLGEGYEDREGKEVWVGMGWIREKDIGKGVFMEKAGSTKEEVEKFIKDSLNSLKDYRGEGYGEIEIQTANIKCQGKPVCAIVCAVYKSEGWK